MKAFKMIYFNTSMAEPSTFAKTKILLFKSPSMIFKNEFFLFYTNELENNQHITNSNNKTKNKNKNNKNNNKTKK